jgi:hypothetical protein
MSQRGERCAEIPDCFRIIWSHVDDSAVRDESVLQPALGNEAVGEIVVSGRVARIQFDRPFVGGNRLVMSAQLLECAAKAKVSQRLPRQLRAKLGVLVGSLVPPFEVRKSPSQQFTWREALRRLIDNHPQPPYGGGVSTKPTQCRGNDEVNPIRPHASRISPRHSLVVVRKI